jgi:hypothetical protein
LLERVAYISARKKLIHAMSLNADRPINRAMVAGCAVSATRNYLKITHAPRAAAMPSIEGDDANTQSS